MLQLLFFTTLAAAAPEVGSGCSWANNSCPFAVCDGRDEGYWYAHIPEKDCYEICAKHGLEPGIVIPKRKFCTWTPYLEGKDFDPKKESRCRALVPTGAEVQELAVAYGLIPTACNEWCKVIFQPKEQGAFCLWQPAGTAKD